MARRQRGRSRNQAQAAPPGRVSGPGTAGTGGRWHSGTVCRTGRAESGPATSVSALGSGTSADAQPGPGALRVWFDTVAASHAVSLDHSRSVRPVPAAEKLPGLSQARRPPAGRSAPRGARRRDCAAHSAAPSGLKSEALRAVITGTDGPTRT